MMRGFGLRDTAGNSVLGIYAGEAATKSWARFTLAPATSCLGAMQWVLGYLVGPVSR